MGGPMTAPRPMPLSLAWPPGVPRPEPLPADSSMQICGECRAAFVYQLHPRGIVPPLCIPCRRERKQAWDRR